MINAQDHLDLPTTQLDSVNLLACRNFTKLITWIHTKQNQNGNPELLTHMINNFFKKIFGGYKSFLWASDTPVLDF